MKNSQNSNVFSLEKEKYTEIAPKSVKNLLNSVTKSGKKKIPVGKIGKLPNWLDTKTITSWERKNFTTWEEFFSKRLSV